MIHLFVAASVFFIPSGPASYALNDFGVQSKLQLLFNFEDMMGVATNAVSGELDNFAALDDMIAGTDITYEYVNRRTVTLTRLAAEGYTPHVFSQDGWYYRCVDFDLVAGFLLSRQQRLAWNIGVATEQIPADQMWCTRDIPMLPDASPEPTMETREITITSARPYKHCRWKCPTG